MFVAILVGKIRLQANTEEIFYKDESGCDYYEAGSPGSSVKGTFWLHLDHSGLLFPSFILCWESLPKLRTAHWPASDKAFFSGPEANSFPQTRDSHFILHLTLSPLNVGKNACTYRDVGSLQEARRVSQGLELPWFWISLPLALCNCCSLDRPGQARMCFSCPPNLHMTQLLAWHLAGSHPAILLT